MKPLHVALIVKDRVAARLRDGRQMGVWSYPVEQFTWEHVTLGKGHRTDRARFADSDLILHEDAGNWGEWRGSSGPPVVFHSIDSTLSFRHLAERVTQAQQADLVLVEQGTMAPFHDRRGGEPEPLPYCVNDRVFRPLPKSVDAAFHCTIGTPGGAERRAAREALLRWSESEGHTLSCGPLGLPDYAAAFGVARVVVNWSRTPQNRPHRLLDALAAGACVLSGPYGDRPNPHVRLVSRPDELPAALDELLADPHLAERAEAGLRLVAARHTWAVRAIELRTLLSRRLGL